MSAKSLSINGRFKLGFLINTVFMLFEFTVGLFTGSLVLVADATHNLTDSITLVISWLGNRVSKKPADSSHTLGHGRVEVLTAFVNSTILAAISLLIFYEAYQRLVHPVGVKGGIIAVVALIGIFANGTVALLFRKYKSDINVKAAYTNMAFDMIFSVASMIAGVLILLTNQSWIDPIISIGVGFGLLYAAFGILRQATNIFLEGVPPDVDLDKVRATILSDSGVKEVKNLFVWAISSNEYILCCTIVPKSSTFFKIQDTSASLRKKLKNSGYSKVIIEAF